MLYKYYLKARAPSPGAQPSGFVGMVDYGARKKLSMSMNFLIMYTLKPGDMCITKKS